MPCTPLLVSLPPQPYSIRRKIRLVQPLGSEAEELEKYKHLLCEAMVRESDLKTSVQEGDQKLSALRKTLGELKAVRKLHRSLARLDQLVQQSPDFREMEMKVEETSEENRKLLQEKQKLLQEVAVAKQQVSLLLATLFILPLDV